MIWPKACLLLTGRKRRNAGMGEAGVGVIEGAAGVEEEDDRRACAALAIGYCCFCHLFLSCSIDCKWSGQEQQHSANGYMMSGVYIPLTSRCQHS